MSSRLLNLMNNRKYSIVIINIIKMQQFRSNNRKSGTISEEVLANLLNTIKFTQSIHKQITLFAICYNFARMLRGF